MLIAGKNQPEQRRRNFWRKYGAGDYHATCERVGDGGSDGNFYGGGHGHGAIELSMVARRHGHQRRYFRELYNGGHGDNR